MENELNTHLQWEQLLKKNKERQQQDEDSDTRKHNFVESVQEVKSIVSKLVFNVGGSDAGAARLQKQSQETGHAFTYMGTSEVNLSPTERPSTTMISIENCQDTVELVSPLLMMRGNKEPVNPYYTSIQTAQMELVSPLKKAVNPIHEILSD